METLTILSPTPWIVNMSMSTYKAVTRESISYNIAVDCQNLQIIHRTDIPGRENLK